MSYFTNPFAPSSPVPVFASSPLNPIPNSSTYPLPANLRRASLVRAAPASSSSPSSSSTDSGLTTTMGSSNAGNAPGGGITFVSPFSNNNSSSKGGLSPAGPPPSASPGPPTSQSRRGSAASPGGRTIQSRATSHSRTTSGAVAMATSSNSSNSPSPGLEGVAPNSPVATSSRRGSLQSTTPLRSPAATVVNIPFFSNIANAAASAQQGPASTTSFLNKNGPVDFSRRRSVDVGVLGLGTHRQNGVGSMSKRVREAVGPDAGDKDNGFVPTPGLKGGKDRLLGRHLAGILAHSLSLCSDPPPSATEPAVPETAGNNDMLLGDIPGSPDPSPSTSRNTSVSESILSSTPSLSDTAPTYESSIPSRPPAPTFPVLSEAKRFKLIGNLQSWTFNPMGYSSDELLSCVGIMFESVRNMEGVSFDLERMKALLLSLRSAYHARNGYHNFSHATDVTQACYSFLVRMGLAPPLYLLCEDDYDANLGEGRRKWRRNRAVEEGGMGELLRPMDVFALLVAAIGHDVGHPGLSNAYMVNARTPVAQVYDDKSVLENFHTVTLIHMLRRHNFDYLLGGDFGHLGDQATSFRKVVEASILATDMSRHFGFVNQLNDMGRRFGERRGLSSSTIEADRLLLCSGLIKCADISNPTRPHRISRAWSTALLDEWNVQAAIETEFGLPISVMTLDPTDTKAQAKSQVGFIDLFAKPLFNAMAGVVDEFADFAEKLRDGRIAWEAISLQADEAFSKPPVPREFKLAPAPIGRSSLTAALAAEEAREEKESDSPSSPDSTSTVSKSKPILVTPTPRSKPSFRPNVLALQRHSHHGGGVHNRQMSDGSTSSANNSPLSPCFPGSVSSVTTGATSSLSGEGGELGSSPSTPSLFARSPRGGGFYHPDYNKTSCGGACHTATATCETCSRRQDPGARRESLGRALAGILVTEDHMDDDLELRDDYADDEADTWPSWCFRPSMPLDDL
ncbi:HD-domain/PDEase-like protein [Meredithblackwellia eburnea MCA 4105]